MPKESRKTSDIELTLPGTNNWWNSSENPYNTDKNIANKINFLYFPFTREIDKNRAKKKKATMW